MKLTKHEVTLLAAFVYQLQLWQSEHGSHADTVKIDYDADEGYLIETAEPKGKRKRTTKFEGEIMAWVENQLFNLGFERVRTKTLILNYENGHFEINHGFEIAEEEVIIHDDAPPADNQAELAEHIESQAHHEDDAVEIEE